MPSDSLNCVDLTPKSGKHKRQNKNTNKFKCTNKEQNGALFGRHVNNLIFLLRRPEIYKHMRTLLFVYFK